MCQCMISPLLALGLFTAAPSGPPEPTLKPLVSVVDLDLGQSRDVQLCDGSKVHVKLLQIDEKVDSVREGVRSAGVAVEVNGQRIQLLAAPYQLPQTQAGVQIDCPVTRGYLKNAQSNYWGLASDARLRLWPAGSPWMQPGTFGYPVRQCWFASSTQMANEPCYVDGGENPKSRKIYYHYGLDFGGCEGLVEIVAATDGLVVSSGRDALPGYAGTPVNPRYDVVYVLDSRGWYYRYSHLFSIDATIKPGHRVRMGDRIGILGKEGGSGGWSHLHFDIHCRMPSGQWGCQESYAFAWEAYQRQHQPQLIAVARPHHTIFTGETVLLDATRSWSAAAPITRYHWTFTDGSTAEGKTVRRRYDRPGYYSEILKVTAASGQVDYDFAIVDVVDRADADPTPPTIHATYHPTFGIRPGDAVTFKVRTFGTTDGAEEWDFGDGSPRVETRSDGNVKALAKDGYAQRVHRFAKPGVYLVRVTRSDRRGWTAFGHLRVRVEAP